MDEVKGVQELEEKAESDTDWRNEHEREHQRQHAREIEHERGEEAR